MAQVIKGNGGKGFWQAEASHASKMRDQAIYNDSVLSSYAQQVELTTSVQVMAQLRQGEGLDGAEGKMRACIDIINVPHPQLALCSISVFLG